MERGDSIAREKAYNLSQALRYCGAGVEKCHVKNKEGRDKLQEINGTFCFLSFFSFCTFEVVLLPLSRWVVYALQWSLKVIEGKQHTAAAVGRAVVLVSRKRGSALKKHVMWTVSFLYFLPRLWLAQWQKKWSSKGDIVSLPYEVRVQLFRSNMAFRSTHSEAVLVQLCAPWNTSILSSEKWKLWKQPEGPLNIFGSAPVSE